MTDCSKCLMPMIVIASSVVSVLDRRLMMPEIWAETNCRTTFLLNGDHVLKAIAVPVFCQVISILSPDLVMHDQGSQRDDTKSDLVCSETLVGKFINSK